MSLSHSAVLVRLTAVVALTAGVAAVPAAALGQTAPAAGTAGAAVVPGRIVVSWEPATTAAERDDVRRRHGLRTAETHDALGVEVVTVPPETTERVVTALARARGVESAEPDVVVETASTDPAFDRLWGLHNTGQTGGVADVDVDAPEAWSFTRGSAEVVVAVVDTGLDLSHPDLADNLWTNPGEIAGNGLDDDGNGYVDDVHGWDFHSGDNTVFDDATEDRHGTHVAGTIAAAADNGVGIAGVAPNVRIMPVKFLGGPDGSGTGSGAAAAVAYAAVNGATVINASWAGGGGTALKRAITDAVDSVVVAAAGNAGIDIDGTTSSFPAAWSDEAYGMPTVLSVAAVDHHGLKPTWSNYGARSVDVGAPGVSILSTVPGTAYASYSGTSMAAPHAAGVAALVASLDPSLAGAALADAVKAGVQPLASMQAITTTGGLTNADGAVSAYVVPGAPVDPSAVAGIGSATVSWQPPTDGGTPRRYTVTVAPTDGVTGDVARTVDAGSTTLVFDGLTAGTAYTFTVTAGNRAGTSAAAGPTAPVTPVASTSTDGGDSSTAPAPAPEPSPSPSPSPSPEPSPEPSPDPSPSPSEDEPTPAPYDGNGARSLERACPEVTDSGFADVPAGTTHAIGVGCAAAWGVYAGAADGRFDPGAQLSRGQLASVLVRAIEQARGQELPAGRDRFTDDDASVHRAAIDKLAEAGIVSGIDADTYGPTRPVARDQFAAMLARTYHLLAGPLPAGDDAFGDDDGTLHESSIDGLAAIGVVAGRADGIFQPSATLTRDQSATFAARLLDALVEAGAATRPTA